MPSFVTSSRALAHPWIAAAFACAALACGGTDSLATASVGSGTGTGGGGGGGGVGGNGGSGGAPSVRERLWLGTGEYSAAPSWHAVLRFEDADAAAVSPGEPDATLPVKQLVDKNGVPLLFAHGIYVHEGRDELWMSTLFTNPDGAVCMMCMPEDPTLPGSVGVLASASKLDGPQTLTRHLFGGKPQGDLTTLTQPHGLWIDEPRDVLYVANTFGRKVLAFDGSATLDGNVPPSRVIDPPQLGTPVFVFVDSEADRLFVASMMSPTSPQPAIVMFNKASTRSGSAAPDMLIRGASTRLSAGNNQTTHNVWFDKKTHLLFAAHHTNEVLIFDLSGVDLDNPPSEMDPTPRVLDVSENDAEVPHTNVYGLYYVKESDRLYVSVGYANMGPKMGTPPNGVFIYEGASAPAVAGRAAPSARIGWSTGTTYFPPQPLWVTRVVE